jgi:hypothetical protein
MRGTRRLVMWLQALAAKRRVERELDEEMRFHIEMEAGEARPARCTAERSATAREPRVRQRRVAQGGDARRARARAASSGRRSISASRAPAPQDTGLHGRGRPDAGVRHRRQRGGVQRREWRAAASARLPGCRPHRVDHAPHPRGLAAGAVAELLGRAPSCTRAGNRTFETLALYTTWHGASPAAMPGPSG